MSIKTDSEKLLNWYDRNGRDLPWRYKNGNKPDPYVVWLSEIMLQQTTVAVVKGYFSRFINRWPTLFDLSKASLDEVLQEWSGLGYYARARNLHKCAEIISKKYLGKFPQNERELIQLPGVGEYTSAAIMSIAFNKKATVVDSNVERVISRIFAITESLPSSKRVIRKKAQEISPANRFGDYSQAIMDLGSTICLPKTPLCVECPWEEICQARMKGIEKNLPVKKPKKPKPLRQGICFWIIRHDGYVLLRKRQEKGLLGGMMEIPSTPWEKNIQTIDKAIEYSPLRLSMVNWSILSDNVKHVFSHFNLLLIIASAKIKRDKLEKLSLTEDFVWVNPNQINQLAIPSLTKKIARVAKRK